MEAAGTAWHGPDADRMSPPGGQLPDVVPLSPSASYGGGELIYRSPRLKREQVGSGAPSPTGAGGPAMDRPREPSESFRFGAPPWPTFPCPLPTCAPRTDFRVVPVVRRAGSSGGGSSIHTYLFFKATEPGGCVSSCIHIIASLGLVWTQLLVMHAVTWESSYPICSRHDECREGEWCAPSFVSVKPF